MAIPHTLHAKGERAISGQLQHSGRFCSHPQIIHQRGGCTICTHMHVHTSIHMYTNTHPQTYVHIHTSKSQKGFLDKKSACRDGTLKIPTKLDGNDATILSHHPHILCHFANYALCLLFVCIGGLWKAVECIGSDAWECIVHD